MATVKGTSWTDKDVNMAEYYNYSVVPERYGTTGQSKSEGVYIEPVYQSVSMAELCKNRFKYKNCYVKFGSTKVSSYRANGKDYLIILSVKANNLSYSVILIMEDYKNWSGEVISRFKLTSISGSGKVTSVNGTSIRIVMSSVSYSYKK